ncbi:hypothetical protein AX16_005427 [Volvariella volvacea WC 439]|nr:hypothetical protein AX16_005427 [Volvariella volvacea WC 439]
MNFKRSDSELNLNEVAGSARFDELHEISRVRDYEGLNSPMPGQLHVLVVNPANPAELAQFLSTASLTPRSVIMAPTPTNPHYDTTFEGLTPNNVPYYLCKSSKMAQEIEKDLFEQVLPKFRVITNPSSLNIATQKIGIVNDISMDISNAEGVRTDAHNILGVRFRCTEAVTDRGSFSLRMPDSDPTAGAIMMVESQAGESLIAGLNISPAMYQEYCNDSVIDKTCGPLKLERVEFGFRALLFKLLVFALKSRCPWAFIYGGTHTRILRPGYKGNRPYAIISGQFLIDSSPPISVHSRLCYMLLTWNTDVEIVQQNQDGLPMPPPTPARDLVGIPQPDSFPTPNEGVSGLWKLIQKVLFMKDRKVAQVPTVVSSAVLHTTAGAGDIELSIQMEPVNFDYDLDSDSPAPNQGGPRLRFQTTDLISMKPIPPSGKENSGAASGITPLPTPNVGQILRLPSLVVL